MIYVYIIYIYIHISYTCVHYTYMIYYKELAHMIMEPKELHDLLSIT